MDDVMKRLLKQINSDKNSLRKSERSCNNLLEQLKTALRTARGTKKTNKLQEKTRRQFQSYEDLVNKIRATEKRQHEEIVPNHIQEFENMEKYRLKVLKSSLEKFLELFKSRKGIVNSLVSSLEGPVNVKPEIEMTETLMSWSDRYDPPRTIFEEVEYQLPCRSADIMNERFNTEAPNRLKAREELKRMMDNDMMIIKEEKKRRTQYRNEIEEATQTMFTRGTPVNMASPDSPTFQTKLLSTDRLDSVKNNMGRVFDGARLSTWQSTNKLPGTPKSYKGTNTISDSTSTNDRGRSKTIKQIDSDDNISSYFGGAKNDSPSKKSAITFPFMTADKNEDTSTYTEEQKKTAKTRKTRNKIALEIFETEKSYVDGLDSIQRSYMIPFRERANDPEKIIITNDQIKILFGNIETIKTLNSKFLDDLRARLLIWEKKDCLGDVFVSFSPYFNMYKTYVANHELATQELRKLESNNRFQNFLVDAVKEGAAQLSSLLITPIQRIPRYKLLIQEFKKKTPEGHPDNKSLTECLGKVAKVAMSINAEVKMRQNRDQLRELEAKFVGLKDTFISPSRRFIRQGAMSKQCRNKQQPYEFFLFNDLIAYALVLPGDRFRLHRAIQIDSSFSITDRPAHTVQDVTKRFGFMINNSNKSFVVYVASDQDKTKWMKDIEGSMEEVQKMRPGMKDEAKEARSVWQSNTTSDFCPYCKQKFTITKRRHHCRKCGNLVCGTCSPSKMQIQTGSKPERVCNDCKQGKPTRRFSRKSSIKPASPPKNLGTTSLSKVNVKKTNSNALPAAQTIMEQSKSEPPPAARTNMEKNNSGPPPPARNYMEKNKSGPPPAIPSRSYMDVAVTNGAGDKKPKENLVESKKSKKSDVENKDINETANMPERVDFEFSSSSSEESDVNIPDEVIYNEPAPGEDGATADEKGPFPPGWVLFFTEGDEPGIPYYYNENTQETIWERPC